MVLFGLRRGLLYVMHRTTTTTVTAVRETTISFTYLSPIKWRRIKKMRNINNNHSLIVSHVHRHCFVAILFFLPPSSYVVVESQANQAQNLMITNSITLYGWCCVKLTKNFFYHFIVFYHLLLRTLDYPFHIDWMFKHFTSVCVWLWFDWESRYWS